VLQLNEGSFSERPEEKKMKLMRKYLTRFLVSLIALLLPIMRTSESQERIESFDARAREIAVKLWTDNAHYRTVKAYPLSIKRNLHSFWGSLIAASDGRLYLPPATHSDLGASIWLVRFDPRTYMMDMAFEARKQFGHQIGADGLWDSKIHTGVKKGRDGKLYFAGMIGGSYATMYTHMVHPSAYRGGHLYQYDLKTGQTLDMGVPHRYASIIAADLDVERNVFYLLDWPQSEFLLPSGYAVMRSLGTVTYHPTGANNKRLQWGRDIFVYRNHTVWLSNSFGCFVKYDPAIDDLVDTKISLPKNDALRVHVMGRGPTDGKVYCTTAAGWMFEFDPIIEKVVELGPVTEKGPVYSPNLTIAPDGNLYGGTWTDAKPGEKQPPGHLFRLDDKSAKVTDLGIVGQGEGIYTMTSNDPKNILYGVTTPSCLLFSYDLRTGKIRIIGDIMESIKSYLGAAKDESTGKLVVTDVGEEKGKGWERSIGGSPWRKRYFPPRAIICDNQGNVWGSRDQGLFFKYDVKADKLADTPIEMPLMIGTEDAIITEISVDSLAKDSSGMIYGGTYSDGYLFRLNPNTGEAVCFGKPIRQQRIRALAVGMDGLVYGVGGEDAGISKLFRFNPKTGDMRELRVIHERGWIAYRIDTIVIGADATLYLGESSRISHLIRIKEIKYISVIGA
jgi:outer membrane protein assembly factor BamB